MSKQDLLDQIRADILDKNVCSNLAQTAKQLVIGDGDANANIVFIGEAPGKNEDEQGLPFVGAAGKFLNEMLASIGLERSDVYVTNIVKYRPPNNRDPLPEEKKEFFPYLLEQLAVIQPEVIIPLGRHSMGAFLQGMRISEVHGKAYRRKLKISSKYTDTDTLSVVIMPLYHPAAALYNGGLRETLIQDFAQVAEIINLK